MGIIAAALLDMSDGLVPLGFGKSKGLGRIRWIFKSLRVRTVKNPKGRLLGTGALRHRDDGYFLPKNDEMPWEVEPVRVRGFFEKMAGSDDLVRALLEDVATRWPEEVEG